MTLQGLLGLHFQSVLRLINNLKQSVSQRACQLPESSSAISYHFSEDWRYRHAGLMAISAVGEGCHKYMEEMLGRIVEAILPFFQDQVRQNPRMIGNEYTNLAAIRRKGKTITS